MSSTVTNDSFDVRNCPICGKTFIKPIESIYKFRENHRVKYVCSYTCWNKVLRLQGKL